MAKKKHTTKKHKFKHAEPSTTAMTPGSTVPVAAGSVAVRRSYPGVPESDTRDFSYVFGDLQRITIFAGALVLLELVLWYVLGNTGLGTAVYNLIKV